MEHLLAAAFSPWKTISAPILVQSMKHLQPSSRTWFCVRDGTLYVSSASSCLGGYGALWCGICASDRLRKDALHFMILNYLKHARHNWRVCSPFNCGDSPKAFKTQATRFFLGYTMSPLTYDIPFPDYRVWRALPSLQKKPKLMQWELKAVRLAIVIGTDTQKSSW